MQKVMIKGKYSKTKYRNICNHDRIKGIGVASSELDIINKIAKYNLYKLPNSNGNDKCKMSLICTHAVIYLLTI